ncbi:unnamed protein product [Tuber aestivum]|uniref:MOSC domain-containing protein n=1 Tax=Tuber aestivum TaxID=59557 RepID=A0A292PN96_9PEZI|nr:unnamed protein product [Tuber aestivum]
MSVAHVVVESPPLPTLRDVPTPILSLLALGVLAFFSWLVYSGLPFTPKQHGRKLGVETSNLADAYRHGTEASHAGQWKVKGLWIFPVKSCRGIEIAEARVVPSGLEHDRQFVFLTPLFYYSVKNKNKNFERIINQPAQMFAEWMPNAKTGDLQWVFITQRQYPKMALITTKIYLEGEHDGNLHITFPIKSRLPFLKRARTIRFPLSVSDEFKARYPLKKVGIWREQPVAYDISSAVETELRELSAYLCTDGPLALFRVCPEELREVYRNAPTANEAGYQPVTGFADAVHITPYLLIPPPSFITRTATDHWWREQYPLHMLNLTSVRELNSRITDKIPKLDIVRFRANIIPTLFKVTGPGPFTEDDWKKIRLGAHVYYAACRTLRCKMPNVDPDTGERHMQEPDQTLRSYRAIDPGYRHGACLGMQLVPAGSMGILRAGDGVDVLETGPHHYIY